MATKIPNKSFRACIDDSDDEDFSDTDTEANWSILDENNADYGNPTSPNGKAERKKKRKKSLASTEDWLSLQSNVDYKPLRPLGKVRLSGYLPREKEEDESVGEEITEEVEELVFIENYFGGEDVIAEELVFNEDYNHNDSTFLIAENRSTDLWGSIKSRRFWLRQNDSATLRSRGKGRFDYLAKQKKDAPAKSSEPARSGLPKQGSRSCRD
jgi:hypothetical protein